MGGGCGTKSLKSQGGSWGGNETFGCLVVKFQTKLISDQVQNIYEADCNFSLELGRCNHEGSTYFLRVFMQAILSSHFASALILCEPVKNGLIES